MHLESNPNIISAVIKKQHSKYPDEKETTKNEEKIDGY